MESVISKMLIYNEIKEYHLTTEDHSGKIKDNFEFDMKIKTDGGKGIVIEATVISKRTQSGITYERRQYSYLNGTFSTKKISER